MTEEHYIGVDVGKSKIALGLFDTRATLLANHQVPVGPDISVALHACINRILSWCAVYCVRRIGCSIFGPLQSDQQQQCFGSILTSSDEKWSRINIPQNFFEASALPVYFHLDVCAGALAEYRLGSGRNVESFYYLSLGTGIGGCSYARGAMLMNSELQQMGHILVPREPDDEFIGTCRFHGSCLQGLASGKAIKARWGVEPSALAETSKAWDLVARYVASGCVNIAYMLMPQKIILGSGLVQVPGLVESIRKAFEVKCNSFPENGRFRFSDMKGIENATLAPRSSLFGAALLAIDGTGWRFPPL